MAGGLVKAARVRDQRGMTTAEYAVGTKYGEGSVIVV